MFGQLNLWKVRAMQISIVFASAIFLQTILNFNNKGWLGFSAMMIYVGLDSGTTLHRAFHRFWGAMLGLLLAYILFFIIKIHYQIIYLIAPCILFLAYFSLSRFYVTPTIFTVTLTAFGSDYFYSNHKAVTHFFFDYALSTILALFLCVFFEKYFFKKSNTSADLFIELKKNITKNMKALFLISQSSAKSHSRFLKEKISLNQNINRLDAFLQTMKHDFHVDKNIINEGETFNQTANEAYFLITKNFYNIRKSQKNEAKTKKNLEQLDLLASKRKIPKK